MSRVNVGVDHRAQEPNQGSGCRGSCVGSDRGRRRRRAGLVDRTEKRPGAGGVLQRLRAGQHRQRCGCRVRQHLSARLQLEV
eukprot:scaffold4543_cov126-Isochrysis_galbana.AAC.12